MKYKMTTRLFHDVYLVEYDRMVRRFISFFDKEVGRLKSRHTYLSDSDAERIVKGAVMEYFR
jgi:hypothetical protein